MKTQEYREFGAEITRLVQAGNICQAYDRLLPILNARTPFRLSGLIGAAIGQGEIKQVNPFLERIAQDKTEGGWVVIGAALGEQITRDLPGAFSCCRDYIITGDIWYCTDILGERVPGPALLVEFEAALSLLAGWREDANRWVR